MRTGLPRARAFSLVVVMLVVAGCRSKMGTLRDALVDDDVARASAAVDAPRCEAAECLDGLARAFGSKNGFDVRQPDQGSAAAVALVLVREKRGDVVPDADRWISAMTLARGEGADALRLAVAHGMAELAPRVGKRIDDEKEALGVVHDVALAIPGACETYVLMASEALEAMPPEKHPDHAPCVQRDLERKDGPGAASGFGVWRAMAGVVALWKDEARALRTGLDYSDSKARAAIDAKLAVIDAATAKIDVKRVAGGGAWSGGLEKEHAAAGAVPVVDAGTAAKSTP
jgi:hypothetical protein